MASEATTVSGPVWVVDPSLFTPDYDAALVDALRGEGIDAELLTRPARDRGSAPKAPNRQVFYRRFDTAPKRMGVIGAALKAAEHCLNMIVMGVRARHAQLAHFQWLPFPIADRFALMLWRRHVPVVVTVHDTTPFNATPTSRVQSWGFRWALAQADRLIVHTRQGKARLEEMGLDPARIAVIPHGVFDTVMPNPRPKNRRWTLVAFGKIRPYKGVDVLIEALALLTVEERARLHVIVAGEPMMDLAAIKRRIAEAGLTGCIDLRLGFLDDTGVSELFAEADAFVFPYREIEASGVLYQVIGQGRWIIASDIGAFGEVLRGTGLGDLVPPEDANALAKTLRNASLTRPLPTGNAQAMNWQDIARLTKGVYEEVLSRRHAVQMSAGDVEQGVGT